MEGVVSDLFSAGLALSTKRTYRSGTNRYIRMCSLANVTPFPVSEKSLCLFVGHLFADRLSSQTVKSYLAAVRYSQISLGLGDPRVDAMPQLGYVLRGAKKLAKKGKKPRLPISPEILHSLRSYWERLQPGDDFNIKMLWAAACMCFFGFLRSGEIVVPSAREFDPEVHLAQGDVLVSDPANPSYIEVRIKASKTDPFRLGVSVYLGRTGSLLCPVAAILSYMVTRGPESGAFFRFEDGKPLTRQRFVKEVRTALAASGIDASLYSGHSFRIGAATTAAQRGVSDAVIKMLGRWESSAYTLYIRTPRSQLCEVTRIIA